MNIAVIGTGYVGLVTGTCLAEAGHQVVCVDNNLEKVARMQAGEIPIYEPGLAEIFKRVQKNGTLTVTSELSDGVKGSQVIFLALPTPPGADGSADLSAVLGVASQLGGLLQDYTVVVNKSTVPVGTGEQVTARIAEHATVKFDVVSNPEFLREGLAVQDFQQPDRIVIGTDSSKARKLMGEVYGSFVSDPAQLVYMDRRSAEMTKYAANAFLAMKVSFMNEMANLCEKVGANIDAVRLGIGPDKRIGDKFLMAGIGYGGSCFPKDVQALLRTSAEYDSNFKLLQSIVAINEEQKQRLVGKVSDYYHGKLKGKHFALWGLAFKPDTDDIREAPSLEIIDALLEKGATICAYDPEAMENVQRHFGERPGLTYAEDALSVAKGADALLIATEWKEFSKVGLSQLKKNLGAPVVFDGRNMYTTDAMRKAGFQYDSIGRPLVKPERATLSRAMPARD